MFSRIRELHSTAAWRISTWTTLAFSVGATIAFTFVYLVVARAIQERSDAWLSGEAEVLADVSRKTARDALYGRVVEEVAELASREVQDQLNEKGQHRNTVFFLQVSPGQEPLWVGPGKREDFLRSISNTTLRAGIPGELRVAGWKHPFRVVYQDSGQGNNIYLGFSDTGARHMLRRLLQSFLVIWCGLIALGFVISFAGAYRTLLRVEDITETAAKISDNLSARLPEARGGDEISRLSRTFNHMLDRIQSSVNQMRALTDSIAHDLKSPVTSIRGKLEVALSNGHDSSWQEPVAEAIEGLDGLSQLLNTALDVAEAEAGALPLNRELVDLGDLVQHVVDLYQPAFFEKNHELSLHLESGVEVEADISYLNRTLANLLDNELKHVSEGHRIIIEVSVAEGEAQLSIKDDGQGFSPEVRRRAFQRFVKGKGSTGHGLGLAFVDAVAQAHSGHVSIGDSPGGGASILLALPLASRQVA